MVFESVLIVTSRIVDNFPGSHGDIRVTSTPRKLELAQVVRNVFLLFLLLSTLNRVNHFQSSFHQPKPRRLSCPVPPYSGSYSNLRRRQIYWNSMKSLDPKVEDVYILPKLLKVPRTVWTVRHLQVTGIH